MAPTITASVARAWEWSGGWPAELQLNIGKCALRSSAKARVGKTKQITSTVKLQSRLLRFALIADITVGNQTVNCGTWDLV